MSSKFTTIIDMCATKQNRLQKPCFEAVVNEEFSSDWPTWCTALMKMAGNLFPSQKVTRELLSYFILLRAMNYTYSRCVFASLRILVSTAADSAFVLLVWYNRETYN